MFSFLQQGAEPYLVSHLKRQFADLVKHFIWRLTRDQFFFFKEKLSQLKQQRNKFTSSVGLCNKNINIMVVFSNSKIWYFYYLFQNFSIVCSLVFFHYLEQNFELYTLYIQYILVVGFQ